MAASLCLEQVVNAGNLTKAWQRIRSSHVAGLDGVTPEMFACRLSDANHNYRPGRSYHSARTQA